MRRANEARLYALTTATACALALLAGVIGAPTRAVMQNLVFDQYQRWKPRPYAFDQPVRIVLIDEESLKRLGQWPWPRERLAALVEALKGAGAAAIAFDFLFAEKDRADANAATGQTPDDVFARAIDGAPVVLGSFVSEAPSGPGGSVKAGFVTAGDDATKFLTPSPGALAPLSQLAQHAAGVGFLNWRPDTDRVVRRVPLILNVDGALHPSLAMEALRVAQGASTYIVKSSNASGETAFGEVYGVLAIRNGDLTIDTDPAGDIRVYFARPDPRRSIPAWKVLEPGADLSGLRGAIVFVGASAATLSDIVATPLTPVMPGVEAHAQIVEQLLSGQTLRRPDWAPSAEWIATALICAALVATTWMLAPYLAALVFAAVVGAIVAVSWFAFSRHGVLIEPTYPAFSAAAVYFTGVSTLYAVKRHQEREIRSAFGRFVSPAVVARLAEMPGALELGGLQRELTLLFCDIRSFTTISEGFNASELTHFLNEYLTPMTDAILDREGTIDKYMGDAIMAFWNAPLDDPEHAAHAVESALTMRETLVALNEGWREPRRGRGAPIQAGAVRHWAQFGRVLRRQSGLAAPIRLFGDRRRSERRLATRRRLQDFRGRHYRQRDGPFRGIRFRLARDRFRPGQGQDAPGRALRARGRRGACPRRRVRGAEPPPRGDARGLSEPGLRRCDFHGEGSRSPRACRGSRPLLVQLAPVRPIGRKRPGPRLAPCDRARRKISADLKTRSVPRGPRGALGRSRHRACRSGRRPPPDFARTDRPVGRQTRSRRS